MKPPREKPKEPEWTECPTLMEWAERMFREGYPQIVAMMARTLPLEQRKRFKDLYERIKAEKAGST